VNLSVIVTVGAGVSCINMDIRPLYLCDLLENRFSGHGTFVPSTVVTLTAVDYVSLAIYLCAQLRFR